MTTADLTAVTAYAVSIAAVVAVVLQLIKTGLIDPRVSDSPQRDALLRGLSYLLNFGALIGVLALNNLLNWSQVLVYISLAFGQSVGSHVLYTQLSGGSSPQPAPAPLPVVEPPANDVKVLPEITDGAAATLAPPAAQG
jgi:hypothetical protein